MKPVQYSPASQSIVESFEARPPDQQVGAYWGEDEASPVRKEIKDHYIAEQQRKCCYCRVAIPTNHNGVWDGEHIISRHGAARFMFRPLNLAISCKDCNGAKREKEVRRDASRVSFPDKSEHYLIVHPHFDEYSDHIRWMGNVVYPTSRKGVATVDMCDLHRYGLDEVGAPVVPVHPAMDRQLGVLMNPQSDLIEMKLAISAAQTYLETVPQK
ncbi:HNH endonuclease [Rhizobium ruizarguesonis]